MKIMNVFVLLEHIGMEIGVKMMDVLVVNNGMEMNVLVQMAFSSMIGFVSNVSMDKYGMQFKSNVFVNQGISGMEIIVTKFMSVLEEESIMKHSNNVFVLKVNFGMDIHV